MSQRADIRVYEEGGSVALVMPISEQGEKWIDEMIDETAVRLGKSVAVEKRYLYAVLLAMAEDNLFIVPADFRKWG
jgi:hypothetical protein